jgi:hypothetical protein
MMRAREGGDADQVERWPIDRLIPYAKNSRTHSEAQIAQLAASMKEWGWTNPVLADEAGGVIAGHARILAARQLGYGEVPVIAPQLPVPRARALCARAIGGKFAVKAAGWTISKFDLRRRVFWLLWLPDHPVPAIVNYTSY